MANRKLFSFTSRALPSDSFLVVRFTGREALSQLYAFDITLLALAETLDPAKMLAEPATFTLHGLDGDQPVHGRIAKFYALQRYGDFIMCRVVLMPRIVAATLTVHHRIFLDKSLPEFGAAALDRAGLAAPEDFEFRCEQSYPSREYVCQYAESDFNFLSRWLERDGVYYFFEQGSDRERLVLTDTTMAHSALPHAPDLVYAPRTGGNEALRERVIESFSFERRSLPQRVLLKDYNYRKPELAIQAQAVVTANGFGQMYSYGEHIQTPDEAKRLAAVRQQELLCRETVYKGESASPYLRAGYTFTLDRHFRPDCNQEYLVLAVEHEGGQETYLTSGLGVPLEYKEGEGLGYRNKFTAIPARVQFRPERKAKAPRISGSLNAHIDSASSGEYAEIDGQGRYKILLPFDLSGRKDGGGSAWVRMAQPYAGANHGMHFPLHKGTEVLLTFINGDPDRPVIAAAVPNPATPSPVTSANNTQSRITTAGGNKIHFEDKEGMQRVLLHTPTANTWIRLGSPNDPPAPAISDGEDFFEKNAEGFAFATEKSWGEWYGENLGIKIWGNATTVIVGGYESINVLFYNRDILGLNNEIWIGGWIDILFSKKLEMNVFKTKSCALELEALDKELKVVETKVQKIDAKVAAKDKKVTALTNHVSASTTQINLANREITARAATLDARTSELTAKKTLLATAETDIQAVTGRISAKNEAVLAAMDRTDADVQRIDALSKKISLTMDQEDISGVMVDMFDEKVIV